MDINITKKLEESIDILKVHKFIKVNELVISGQRNNRIAVNGYIFYKSINDIPVSSLPNELKMVKESFKLLMSQSEAFKKYAMEAGIDYYVVLDYQTGGVVICAEIDGQYKVF